jgi:hypothetical protein
MTNLINKTTIEEALENIKNLAGEELTENEFYNKIICAFEDYEFEEESRIYVGESNNNGYNYIAYAETKNSPQILIKATKTDNIIIITDAWIA